MKSSKIVKHPKHFFTDQWERPGLVPMADRLTVCSAVLLLVYAATFMITDSFGTYVQRLVVASGFFVWLFCGKSLRKGPLLWLLAAAILIPVVSWGAAHLTHPQWAESSPKVHRLTSWFMFIPVAVWLGGREKNVLTLWSAAVFGLLLAPWVSGGGWEEIARGLFKGRRIDFALHNAQHAGLLFAVALLGLVSFCKRFWSGKDRVSWLRGGLWLVLLVFLILGVLVTQSRGIWLGLVGAFAVMGLLVVGLSGTHKKIVTVKRLFVSSVIGAIVLAVLIFSGAPGIIEKRLTAEKDYILKVIGVKPQEKIKATRSVGTRVTTWDEGIAWIKEKPLVGWGGNGRRIVILNSEVLPRKMKSFGHFHSSYVDVLVMFGLPGLLLFLSLFCWFFYRATVVFRRSRLPLDFYLFFAAFVPFWLVVNAFESYMFFASGGYVLSLVLGGTLSLIWTQRDPL